MTGPLAKKRSPSDCPEHSLRSTCWDWLIRSTTLQQAGRPESNSFMCTALEPLLSRDRPKTCHSTTTASPSDTPLSSKDFLRRRQRGNRQPGNSGLISSTTRLTKYQQPGLSCFHFTPLVPILPLNTCTSTAAREWWASSTWEAFLWGSPNRSEIFSKPPKCWVCRT